MPLSSQMNGISSAEVEADHDYSAIQQGYDETSTQWENQPYLVPHSDVQVENNSFVYCMPSHITCAPEQTTSFEDQSSFQKYLSSAEYVQQTMPVYSLDPKVGSEDLQTKPKVFNVSEIKASLPGAAGPSNSEDVKPMMSENKFVSKASPEQVESRIRQPTSSSNSSRHSVRPFKAPQLGPGGHPARIPNGFRQLTKMQSSYQGHGSQFPKNNFSESRPCYPTANNNYRFQMREKPNLQKSYGVTSELVRGPRATRVKKASSSFPDKDSLNSYAGRDQYNKPDFQVKYEQAKFFMIKSYSEDDVHKSIKYSVWSSTANGNNKLDSAYRKAEMEKNEKGEPCPIFLFFSVNSSGQFVGLAEMIGPVDFKKKMDFWQQDKWNGFFPVKWHIIKDIPNRNFLHITLENNDNNAVTFSRDTQEIMLPQGLSMLLIFKAYQIGTSILDDIDFYEENEKLSLAKRSSRTALETFNVDFVDDSSMTYLESSFENMSMSARAMQPLPASKYYPTNFTSRPCVNSRSPVSRSLY